jgi:hypothetical protein
MAKKHDFSDKKIRLSCVVAVVVAKICIDSSSVPLKARKMKIWLLQSFEPT